MTAVGLIASINLGATATTTTTVQKAFADSSSDHCSNTQFGSDPFTICFFGPNSNEFAKAIKEDRMNLKE